jgi:hypothetical protein
MFHIRKWIGALLILSLAACGGGGSGGESPTPMGALQLTPATATLAEGASVTMSITGGTGPYRVQSSNPAVISVPDRINNQNAATFSVTAGSVDDATSVDVSVVDSTGALVKSTITVTYTPISISPQSLTLTSQSSQVFHVYGGTKPYSISSSNPIYFVFDQTNLSNGTFVATGNTVSASVSGLDVIVTDAKGRSAKATLTLSPSYIFSSLTALPMSNNPADTTITGGMKGTVNVQLSQSYIGVRSIKVHVVSGPATLDNADVNGDVTVNTSAIGAASIPFSTSSSQGPAYIVFRVTDVTSATTADLTTPLISGALATTPTTIDLGTGCTTPAVGVITGGMPPYSLLSSNPSVYSVAPASVTTDGGSFTVKGLACGTGNIIVKDNINNTILVPLTSTAPTPTAMAVSPTTVTQVYPKGSTSCAGQSSNVMVTGGTPPYSVVGGNNAVATVSPATVQASGGSFSITGVSCGTISVSVADSAGSAPVAVTFTSSIAN